MAAGVSGFDAGMTQQELADLEAAINHITPENLTEDMLKARFFNRPYRRRQPYPTNEANRWQNQKAKNRKATKKARKTRRRNRK